MPPEIWALLGVIASVGGSFGVAKLNARAQNRRTEVDREVGAGELALQLAREAKADSAAAKLESTGARAEAQEAHREAGMAQRALHQTRIWYLTEHLPWDQAVMAVIERLDPTAADKLPPRREPPLWPKDLNV